ncbi:hypothetical protein [Methylobacterium segetis]|uniref:hypothetical protein n=1 Tax=Methylobacterium segetis TaxID=2488750 RepID=UPI001047221B|nr:hypothetical protein [Methylobacterium segetis]
MMQRDPISSTHAGPASEVAAGASLPFLPTLATAFAIAALSLLCGEPSGQAPAAEPPASVQAAIVPAVGERDFHPPAEVAETARPAAALAFAQIYPFLPVEPRLAAAPRPARMAAAPRRAPCAACTEAGPRHSEATHAAPAADLPATAGTEAPEDSLLPRLALPFAPAVRVVDRALDRAAGYVRTGVTALGGSVSVVVDRLN